MTNIWVWYTDRHNTKLTTKHGKLISNKRKQKKRVEMKLKTNNERADKGGSEKKQKRKAMHGQIMLETEKDT